MRHAVRLRLHTYAAGEVRRWQEAVVWRRVPELWGSLILLLILPATLDILQRLRSVVSSSANPMSEQEMDLHTIRCAGCVHALAGDALAGRPARG